MVVAGGVNLQGELTWQSNPSLCGPASIANALRSLGETATSETAVLAGTGRCWTGFCFMGLTLDELGDVTRLKTNRTVSVLRDLSPEQFNSTCGPASRPPLHHQFQPQGNLRSRGGPSLSDRGIWRLRTWSSSWT